MGQIKEKESKTRATQQLLLKSTHQGILRVHHKPTFTTNLVKEKVLTRVPNNHLVCRNMKLIIPKIENKK